MKVLDAMITIFASGNLLFRTMPSIFILASPLLLLPLVAALDPLPTETIAIQTAAGEGGIITTSTSPPNADPTNPAACPLDDPDSNASTCSSPGLVCQYGPDDAATLTLSPTSKHADVSQA
eukprot:CAMPEP_0202455194 /NCGR_PEP_ID=MMETSP1360-20130828/12788_1 /ASSEMBLY_ACC=CAM_ASM_000848 /TAXON_ID=515479 /ORGANISM="Licmophora paradoxa, Strain CCMP2313" /LENGTH=120 /DNA_ID=CAMNT_0049074723 /DNA_START=110 /DNA_END=473 /DNA_ORIENTATION=+